MKRYDLVTNYRCGDAIEEMEASDDGEWVRYEDAEAVSDKLLREIEHRAALHGSEAGPQEAREELQRLANVGATDTVSQFLADAVMWAQCDLSQHGEGPSGGYVSRLQSAREAHEAWLSRSEAGVSARVLEWQDISAIQDEQFIIGAWITGEQCESGELSREGDNWFDIVGGKRDPYAWMPLPAPPIRAALGVSPAAPEKELT